MLSVFCSLKSLENWLWAMLHEQLRSLCGWDLCLPHLGSDFIAQSGDKQGQQMALAVLGAAFPLSCSQVTRRAAQPGHIAMAIALNCCCHLCLQPIPSPGCCSQLCHQNNQGDFRLTPFSRSCHSWSSQSQQKQMNYELTIQNLFSCFLTSEKFQ